MNKDNRFYKYMILVLCLLIVLCGFFAFQSTTEDKKSIITVIVNDSSSDRWERLKLGIKHAASDNNVNVNFVSTNRFTSSEEKEIIDDYLTSSDAFLIDIEDSNDSSTIISELLKHGPVVQINTSSKESTTETKVIVDSKQIGNSLASEVILKHKEDIEDKKIGIVTGSLKNRTNLDCTESFKESILKYDAKITWEIESIDSIDLNSIDILIVCNALELESLPSIDNNIEVYGIGGSLIDINKLDTGIITSLIVVNDYYTGYEAITMLAKKIKNRLITIEDLTTPYYVVNKQNLYSSRYQTLLFIDRS
jgi:ribose transport system substrate-binding protein